MGLLDAHGQRAIMHMYMAVQLCHITPSRTHSLFCLSLPHPPYLLCAPSSIIIIIIHYLQDADEEVALEAAEFWLSFCESELGIELLQPVLGRLIPVLMKNMVRSSLL
jgi:hypothetical protein